MWVFCILIFIYVLSANIHETYSINVEVEKNMALRWGIASAGTISNDFVFALSGLPKGTHEVRAVAARSLEKAQKFADVHNIPKAYEGYENLYKDPDVDVVYVGTIHPKHFEVAKMMLEHGKHVLCEKPLTMNAKQARKLIGLAKEKGLFLMEGVWSRFFPVYKEMKDSIDSDKIGEVLQVNVDFGFPIKNERITKKTLGGGITLDLGFHTFHFQQLVFKGLEPTKILASGHLNNDEVDSTMAAILTYPGNKMAVLSASAVVRLSGEAVIYGTKGTIRIPQFWSPTNITINNQEKFFPLPENKNKFHYPNSAGLAYEAEEVRKCINAGKFESDIVPHSDTLKLAVIMDNVRSQIGVVYAEDNETY